MIMAFFSTTSFKPPFSSWTVLFLVILLVNPSSSTSRGEMETKLRSLSEGSEPHHHLETISSSQPSKKGRPEPPSSEVHATPSRWETISSSQRSMHMGSSGGMLRKNSEPVSPDPNSRQHNLEVDANATPSRVSSSQRSMRVPSGGMLSKNSEPEPPRQHNLETSKLSSQRSMSEPTSGGMLRKTNSEPVAPDPNSRRHNLEAKLSSQRSMRVGSEPIAGMLPKNSEPTSRQHNSEIKSGGLFFGMLPKGNPVPPSGPSRSHN